MESTISMLSQLQLKEESTQPLLETILDRLVEMPIKTFGKKNSKDPLIATKEVMYAGRLICVLALKAIESLFDGKYTNFDALVSENQCELRAWQLALIAKQFLSDTSGLRQQLFKTKEQLIELIEKLHKRVQNLKKSEMQLNSEIVFKEALQSNARDCIELKVPKEVIALTLMYMLTVTKNTISKIKQCSTCKLEVVGVHEETNAGKLNKLQKNVLPALAKPLVSIAKELLSRIGCDALKNQAQIPTPLNEITYKVDCNMKTLIVTKTLLPFYYFCKASFESVVNNNIPVLLKSKLAAHSVEVLTESFDTAFVFYEGKQMPFQEALVNAQINQLPAYIIEVQRSREGLLAEPKEDYWKRLSQITLFELIEMDAAHHSQYLGGLGIEAIPELTESEKSRLEELYFKAEKMGIAQNNPKTAVVTHVFVDTITNQSKSGLII